ncbi:MAG: NAD-dependent DNA ligase LigA [Pyrinomonadaceae bacterium]|nr:NAD-dependent DNA ligase LigA [Phycisphaerales bacterium]
MPKSTPSSRALELRELLDGANRAYYVDASPIMGDVEFDRLLAELEDIERAHPELDDPSSPTHRVGGEPIDGFRTAMHAMPMLSIDNTYNAGDVREWWERMRRGLAEGNQAGGLFAKAESGEGPRDQLACCCDPKIDGIAISLRYEAGTLVQAVTRGDGVKGDDVTHAARTIRAIPLKLEARHAEGQGKPRGRGLEIPDILEIRGEIYFPLAELERVNREREEAGEELFMNPRNAAAGTLKNLDPKIAASRKLGFVAHGRGIIGSANSVETASDFASSHSGFLAAIKSLGVPVPGDVTTVTSIDEILATITQFEPRRHKLPYATDGMVIRLDDFALQGLLGTTSKSPRWIIAYKYPAERKKTKLISVAHQVGKTGKITPRASMEPVLLAGTVVKHSTLHNYGRINDAPTEIDGRRTDIRIGDTVLIEKAGEVIPYVAGVVLADRPKGAKKIVAPATCPECDGPVEVEPPEAIGPEGNPGLETQRRCINPECPAQMREKLIWFAGRKQMDIDGLGEKTVDLIRATSRPRAAAQADESGEAEPEVTNEETTKKRGGRGKGSARPPLSEEMSPDEPRNVDPIPLNSFADIFRLHAYREHLIELDRMGEKKVDNLLAGIEKAKSRGMAKLLGSLGIRHVGDSTAKTLAKHFASIDDLMGADEPMLRPKAMTKEEAAKYGLSPDPKDRPSTELGTTTAPIFHAYLHSDAARHLFNELLKLGVDLTSHEYHKASAAKKSHGGARAHRPAGSASAPHTAPDPNNIFDGKTIVITGTLDSYEREVLKDLLESLGAKVSGSVSGKTSILVTGREAGSKLEKARELGVATMDEAALLEALSKAGVERENP